MGKSDGQPQSKWQAVLPVSEWFLNNIDAYMGAIDSNWHGNSLPIIEEVLQAFEVAVSIGCHVAERIDAVLESWKSRMGERAGSVILKLPEVLVEQPVVTKSILPSAWA